MRGTIVECKRMHRSGEYRGHSADIIQLLVLGDRLLSLGRDGKLLAWRIGEYEAPEVGAGRTHAAALVVMQSKCLSPRQELQHWLCP